MPAGDYWMQPFVNVYTRFPRADGKTVWLHNDQWEGQDWKRSPGNLLGDPVKVTFDPKSATPIRLVATRAIPPIQLPADTAMVKRIRIQSAILTKWWGQPIYLGATVLLPKDYDKHPDVRYPVNYIQDHFSLGAPGGFGRGGEFDRLWMAADTPRFLYVTLQHPSPYYDDSYGVNSENNGPYGDAIIKELIPAVEETFRAIRRAVGAHAVGRIDRRLDRRRPPGVLSGLLRRIVCELPRFGRLLRITRSSTSTRMPTPISSTRAG